MAIAKFRLQKEEMMRPFILAVLFLLASCGSPAKKEKKDMAEGQGGVEAAKVETADAEKDSMPLEVVDYDGLKPLLHKEDGKTYVINFWATWCAPCIKELPYFERVGKEQAENDVKVILVSLDMPTMWKSHLIPFIKRKSLESEIVILDDPKQNEWIPKIDKDWSGAIPATLIYNSQERRFYENPFTYESLNKELSSFLKKS